MNVKRVAFFSLFIGFSITAPLLFEARAAKPAPRDAVALSPTGREVVGRLEILEGQQGKPDEVMVRTDLSTFRIRPTPILNNLLNLEGEARFRFILERVGEGDDESWQIVRYTEIPNASASRAPADASFTPDIDGNENLQPSKREKSSSGNRPKKRGS